MFVKRAGHSLDDAGLVISHDSQYDRSVHEWFFSLCVNEVAMISETPATFCPPFEVLLIPSGGKYAPGIG
jgi:hypothetical protein